MSECHLCLLGLIALSSLLTGVSGVKDVFIRSGKNVRLPCNNALPGALPRCKSTTWLYNRLSVYSKNSAAVELIGLGIIKKDTERHERLSLGSDCSLNIRNISTEDYGSYTCQQWTGEGGKQIGTDARVYLHVLHVSQTQISSDLSVSLSCQLYSYPRVSCDDSISSEGIHLFWVNQAGVKLRSDSRYQISPSSDPCIISLNTTLLNEDHNREWRCEVTQNKQLKTSVTFTVESPAQAKTTTAMTPVHNTNSTTNTQKTTAPATTTTAVINSQDLSTTNTQKTTAPATTTTAVINFQDLSTTNTQKTTAPDKPETAGPDSTAQATTTTAMTPVHNTNSPTKTKKTTAPDKPETAGPDSTVILISAVAAAAVFLTAVLWLICRKRAGNKRGTGETAVKDENEDKVTSETINMSTPAAARDNEQTDDVTYSEVSSSSKKPVKSVKDQDDSVTYAAIRGTQNEPLGQLYASVNKNK
nr:diverse immunoglobulin domain-containing protein DICP-H-7 [Carassius gibelio]